MIVTDHTDAEACVEIIDSTTTASTTYFGVCKSSPYSKAAATWQVKKQYTNSDGDTEFAFADGNALFDNVWANRASLTYGVATA